MCENNFWVKSLWVKSIWVKKYMQEEFLAEESMGEKYIGEKYDSFWVKSLWVKNTLLPHHRFQWKILCEEHREKCSVRSTKGFFGKIIYMPSAILLGRKKSLSNITGLKHANRWKRHFGIWDQNREGRQILKKAECYCTRPHRSIAEWRNPNLTFRTWAQAVDIWHQWTPVWRKNPNAAVDAERLPPKWISCLLLVFVKNYRMVGPRAQRSSAINDMYGNLII